MVIGLVEHGKIKEKIIGSEGCMAQRREDIRLIVFSKSTIVANNNGKQKVKKKTGSQVYLLMTIISRGGGLYFLIVYI